MGGASWAVAGVGVSPFDDLSFLSEEEEEELKAMRGEEKNRRCWWKTMMNGEQ
jgi:hypothetical protein